MFPNSSDSLVRFQQGIYSSTIGGAQDWWWYSSSYDFAIRTLIDHIHIEVNHGQMLTLPIIFLSRHFIEIKIKEILDVFGVENPTTHNLELLWNKLIEKYKENYQSSSEKDKMTMDNTGRIIIELNKLDDKSFNFRYPTDKEGNSSLPFKNFDLLNFTQVIEKVNVHLDCIGDFVRDT